MVSRLWTRISDSDCMKSRLKNDIKFRRISSGSVEPVFVSKTRVPEQPSSASSSYPYPARDTWNGRRSFFKCRCTKYGNKRVSGVWSGRCWFLLGKWTAGCRRCFETPHWYSLFINRGWLLGDGRFSRKPNSPPRRGKQGELSPNNTSL